MKKPEIAKLPKAQPVRVKSEQPTLWVRYADHRPMDETEIRAVLRGKAACPEVLAIMNLLDILVTNAIGEASYPARGAEDRQFQAGKLRAMLEVTQEVEAKCQE